MAKPLEGNNERSDCHRFFSQV